MTATFALCTFLGSCAEDSEPGETARSPTVILVHGIMHQPDPTWGPLSQSLDALGVKWKTVDLVTSGSELVGRAAADQPGITDDVALVKQVVDSTDGPVILVGHSYGGVVISAAGLDARVAQLVYLCAMVPEQGENMQALSQIVEVTDPPLFADPAALTFDPQAGLVSANRDIAIRAFYPDLPAPHAEQAASHLVPVVASLSLEPVGPVAWPTKPSTYVVCDKDEVIAPAVQKAMALRAGSTTHHFDTGHSVMLVDPPAVANVIKGVVDSVAATNP